MTISDGFGDVPTPEEVIPRFDKWAHAVANGMLGPTSPDHDDLVQEARIGIWRALEKFDREQGALASYATQAAKWQMKDAVTRHKWTGQETTRGVRVQDRHQDNESLDALVEAVEQDGSSYLDPMLISGPDAVEQVSLAYHHGEIYAAIDSLSPDHKAYVLMRFWGGMTDPEIKAALGRDLGGMWRAPRGIRDSLRRRLTHLMGAAR